MFLRHWQSNFYATAQLIPNAVPTAARIADAKFHKNLINLDLFSLVMFFLMKKQRSAAEGEANEE